MKDWLALLVVVLLALMAWPGNAIAAESFTIRGSDDFPVGATFYDAGQEGPLVLMFHQCNRDRRMYEALGAALAARGMHALSLDFRGFGGSTNGGNVHFRADNLKELWPKVAGDVDAALAHIASTKRNVVMDRIGTIGASCGGSQSLLLAERNPAVKTAVFFSSSVPWIDLEEVKGDGPFTALPILCVAALDDGGTLDQSRKLFARSKSTLSRLITYKGDGHGDVLFALDPDLEGTFVSWFSRFLRNDE